MTKEELEQLKELLKKAEKTLNEKEMDCFYKQGSLTKIEKIYYHLLVVGQLRLSLDIGYIDQYLLNNESQTESLH